MAADDQRSLRKTRIRWALAGAGAMVFLGIAGAIAEFELGLFDISASDAHLAVVRWFVHHTMIHSVRRRTGGTHAPKSVSPSVVAAGFCEYHEHCQMCHGGPTVARDAWANGLNPPPPYLVNATVSWTPDQLHWIVSNGVKMTAMPSWKASMSDQQVWSVVAFLEAMPKIPPGAYAQWAQSKSCPSGADVVKALHWQQTPALPQSVTVLPAPKGPAH